MSSPSPCGLEAATRIKRWASGSSATPPPTPSLKGRGRTYQPIVQCEISSSASPRVRGPKPPIAITTTTIAAQMKPNTPPEP